VKALQRRRSRRSPAATPTTQLDQRDVALAAIAALGELDTVCRGSVRRENRERIKELVALSGPAVPALKKVLSDEAHAAAAAALSLSAGRDAAVRRPAAQCGRRQSSGSDSSVAASAATWPITGPA
jgi:hypothetical protein